MDAPVAETAPYQGDFNDRCTLIMSLLIQNGRMAIAVSGKPHKATRIESESAILTRFNKLSLTL